MRGKVPPFQNLDRMKSKRPRSGVLAVPAPGNGVTAPEVHVTAQEPGDVDHMQGSTGCYHSSHRYEES